MEEKTFDQVLKEIKGKRILVANRGIPARRIVRSIREIGAVPIVVVTDVDKTAPFTSGSHDLLLLGENPRAYLDADLIIKRAKEGDISAIHPGWGFISEDSFFPMKCEQAGILFVGPSNKAMQLLGNKVKARSLARELGVPIVPGSDKAVNVDEVRELARELGYPILLKAEGGGGGKGICQIFREEQLESAFKKASSIVQSSFGNPRLYVEKLLTSVHHIEIQVIADRYGNVFTFDERDCTVQRHHQKLVEITPSPWSVITPELRNRLKNYSEKLVKKVGYYSLATVEFLVDTEGNPYFIEVNTRLQVEHGITDCRYGIDLVEEQIAIAYGSRLRYNSENTVPFNHAIQVRINFEDPQNSFEPSAGLITRYISPGGPGVRLDSCITAGYNFPPQYDSAAALLIAYGKTWSKVLEIINRALNECLISGVKTTIFFLRQIIKHPKFVSGEYDTNFVDDSASLMLYLDRDPAPVRLSRLVAEISAKGFNSFVQLGEYRGRQDFRIGRFEPVMPEIRNNNTAETYPRGDRKALLEYVRDSGQIHFTDTTTRDITQSNSGNRFRLAEDALVGPYLDDCGFFSIENGGGAHFHVAMLANMTYPFTEAKKWNSFAPKTLKQILIRSTNILGYSPQPKNLMRLTGEMICDNYDIIRCFDFLNHIENMQPFAEVALNSPSNVFEPAISLSWAKGFDVPYYLGVLEEIVNLVAKVSGVSRKKASGLFIIGLKDMAGVCPPRFMRELVEAIRNQYPDLVIHYHRHYTDGLFVPAVGAAALAGAHIVDTGIGSAVRWYGQGEVLSTAAYIEDELGLKTHLNKEMIRTCGFVLKQIMPYFDRYAAPYFQGIDYDVVKHGMPGGATSSSQEGALKQGYIQLLPYILRFLAGTRQVVRYHDVTPGSQITWNTAFLAITGAFKRGGIHEVEHFLQILETVIETPEEALSHELKKERLLLYKDSNDAFRQLLMGKFGRMPLGFPPEWVYESVFGAEYKKVLSGRTDASPLNKLKPVNIDEERRALNAHIKRESTDEELVMYLNHPSDALKTIQFQQRFGDPNLLPLDIWFEGLIPNQDLEFKDSYGRPHHMTILDISEPDSLGMSQVRYLLDHEFFNYSVQIQEAAVGTKASVEMADKDNPYHVASPSNGDLWVMHVNPGDLVNEGEELFNITIMKQEKAVLSPVDGMVKRILKFADYEDDKKMIPVREGELLVELEPVPQKCSKCSAPIQPEYSKFCYNCGKKLKR